MNKLSRKCHTRRVKLTAKLIRCLRIRWGDTNSIWNIWSDIKTRVGTPHKIKKTRHSLVWQRHRIPLGGTPHRKTYTGRGRHRTCPLDEGNNWCGPSWIIKPLCGSILQAETCRILSLAENPRWGIVWQHLEENFDEHSYEHLSYMIFIWAYICTSI